LFSVTSKFVTNFVLNKNKMSIPSLFSITQNEIESVIPSESAEHLSTKIIKTSSCGVNYKTLGQVGLMII
jgi:hypothetical protein